ncbi:MAG: hypothetical protein IJZ36_04720 [Bacilli bacterium]|nr:hypothetical protein [Bacilli bacterium]
MRKTTDLEAVKQMAISFLHIEPEPIDTLGELSGLFITHPFFNSSFLLNPKTQKMFNIFAEPQEYTEYKKLFEQELRKENKVSSILLHINTPYKLTFFKYINQYLSSQYFSKTLVACYTQMEVIADETNVKNTDIIKWFAKADKNYMMNEEEIEKFNNLPTNVTIYRGIRDEAYKYEMSWTLSKSKAEWFATRFDSETPILLKTVVNKNDILCYLNDRDEAEVVIDPSKINKNNVIEMYL